MASTPAARRQAIVSAIVDARRTDGSVAFRPADTGDRVAYENRRLRIEVGPEQRAGLQALLAEYHVFKLQQPATRKADEGVVYLSAVTDPKHAADFVDALFRDVYGFDADYELRVDDG